MARKIRLLYAEDEENARIAYTEILSEQGFDVCAAKDGNEAWEYYLKEEWDILLLDIDMPGKTGEEVIQLVRKHDTKIPIVVFSGLEQDALSVMEVDGGADDYVSKNWSVKTLVNRLGKRLRDVRERIERGEQRVFRLSSRTTYDKVTRMLTIDGKALELKRMQGKIMLLFCVRGNEEISNSEMCMELWNVDGDIKKSELATYISQLRKVLKVDPSIEIRKGHYDGFYQLVVTEE